MGSDCAPASHQENNMRLAVRIAAIVGLALGILWMLQGLNLVGGSFRSGQTLWLVNGAILAVVSLAALLWARRG